MVLLPRDIAVCLCNALSIIWDFLPVILPVLFFFMECCPRESCQLFLSPHVQGRSPHGLKYSVSLQNAILHLPHLYIMGLIINIASIFILFYLESFGYPFLY